MSEPQHPVERLNYDMRRAAEYPPITEFADAYVKLYSDDGLLQKEGRKQMDTYIKNCLAIKARYPKEGR